MRVCQFLAVGGLWACIAGAIVPQICIYEFKGFDRKSFGCVVPRCIEGTRGAQRDKGVIIQHVYHIVAVHSKAPAKPDCTGKVKYVMPIKNGCNNYDWGNMYVAWEGFCEAPKGDGKDDKGDDKPTPSKTKLTTTPGQFV